jgi:hypothetical protein
MAIVRDIASPATSPRPICQPRNIRRTLAEGLGHALLRRVVRTWHSFTDPVDSLLRQRTLSHSPCPSGWSIEPAAPTRGVLSCRWLRGLATAVAVLGSGAVFGLIKLWRYDQLRPIDQIRGWIWAKAHRNRVSGRGLEIGGEARPVGA